MNTRFKQRTPNQIDFEDAGKPDYNIVDTASRARRYVKVPEKQLNAVLDKLR
jgi:hypothetical protein